MLPSTGLFKTIVCPYYETDGCTRPYCHFKHARKDDETAANKPATYIPTPTAAPQLLTLPEPVKKKVKLEYVPTQPAINDAPPKADYVSKSLSAPVYIPSNTAVNLKQEADENGENGFVISDDDEEEKEVKISPKPALSPDPVVSSDVITLSDDEMDDDRPPPDDDDQDTEEFAIPEDITTNGEKKTEPEKPKEKDKERRHSSSSSRSHSSSKHKSSHSSSSTSSKHKSSRDREKSSSSRSKERDKERDKERSSSSSKRPKDHHSSSKSSSHRSHSESSGKVSKSGSSSTSSSKDKKPSSSSHKSSSSRRSSSKSSSSHRKRSHSKERSSKSSSDVRSAKEPKLSKNALACISYETTSDEEEEDIMAQCKAIYEEFVSTATPTDTCDAPTTPTQPATPTSHAPPESTSTDARERKKWLAHEKTATATPLIQPAARKPNYVQSAMQSIFKRQEVVRQQQAEAAAAKAEEERKRAEEERKRAEAKAKEENNLTPLICRNYPQPVRPPPRIVAPASNVLAIERAKKKVEELRAQKQPTPCKTASKVVGRVAHNNTSTATEQSQPAPPVLEASSSKISYNLRMQYYNMMVKYCLDIYATCEDAWERAQTEELAVFKKCSTPVIYKHSAMLTINKLRKESIDAGNINTQKNKLVSHDVILAGKLAQSNAWSITKKKVEEISTSNEPVDKLPGTKVYELVAECVLTDEQLTANGYPRPGPRPGTAIIKETRSKPKPPNPNERYCSRCAKIFDLTIYDDPPADECNYHPKSTGYRRGFADNVHRCCQQPAGTPGCTYADYHISDFMDYDNLTGFVTTIDLDKSVPTRKDIFALDCEMCYTTLGMELTRVTVVDMNGKTVYDALVKPDNKIIDYNTTYSGITEDLLKNEKRTLRDIQAVLLSMFHAKTILVGHSLESDLKALKLIHNMVVDTSVLFPHKMGPPYKRALKTLCIEHLKRIIQENEHGHDSAEDAEVCIQLVKFYLRNKIT